MIAAAPELSHKVAVVTGASSGVGRAYALALAAAGASVVALARRAGDVSAPDPGTLAEVEQAGARLRGSIAAYACDVTDLAQVKAVLGEVFERYGGVDVLVNNVGAYPRRPVLEIDDAFWDEQIAINLKSAFFTCREVLPIMTRRGAGSIVNITAAVAAPRFTRGSEGHDALLLYAVAKAGLNRMTTYLAEELRHQGIAVNALSPGVVRSDVRRTQDLPPSVGALVKAADPEILGPPLLYLAAQTDAGITGQILHSDDFGRSWPDASQHANRQETVL